MIFGSYAHGSPLPDSDVDLLIIGDPDRDDFTERLELASREINRPVNEVVMSQDEYDRRRARGDGLIASIESQASIQVLPPPTP